MLRAKQIGNLSNSARSFFLSGSRSSAADGNSCSCTEDETCVSRRQHTRNEVLHTQKPSTVASKPSTRVGTLLPRDATKVLASHKIESFDSHTSLPKLVSNPCSSGRSDSLRYSSVIEDVQQDPDTLAPIGDQFVKAGVAAVTFLSDFVNHNLPLSDVSGILGLPKSYMVDPTRSSISNVKSSNVKAIKRQNISTVYPESSAQMSLNSANNYRSPKDKGDKKSSYRHFKRAPNAPKRNSWEVHSVSACTSGSRKTIPPRSKAHSDTFISKFNSGVECVTEGFSTASREMKMLPVVSPVSRQFRSTGHVVESVSSILHELKWGPAAEEALQKLDCPVDAYQANQVLKQLQDHTVALGFFYWLKRQSGFKHDGHTYTTMVGILGRAKHFGAIKKLLDQMVQDGCWPNVVTYNRLIHSYGRANYLHEAMDVFKQMQEARCEPDRVTYCTLIDIHAKAGYLDVAMDIYQRMQAAGLSPDTFTYSVIINCLGKAGHLPAAHRLFCEMINQGCVPNLVTYNIMIALHSKGRNYQSALQLYRDMQNAGFEPDKVTYSIIMEVLGHCGYLDEAEAVFTEMKRKNWVPDEPVYGLLVDLWGKVGNVEKAWEWYQAMLCAGLRPNVPTCNSLLSTFLRMRRLSDAYNLLQSMLALDLRPSLQTYTLLLSCCTEAQSPYDRDFCCELMSVTSHPAHMFLLSMPSSGPDGQNVRDHVSKFLDVMHSEDRESKRGLIDAVVDFLHKSGLKEEAGSVWEVAAEKNVYPDAVKEKSSSYWLINLHVMSDGTAVTALSRTLAWFRREMLASGVGPTRIDIVTGWGRRSRVTGSSLVRQAVQELLNIFSSPFFIENGNSGCFVGYGEALNRWLLQSCVDRMHLL